MAGIINNSARQYNVKHKTSGGQIVVVRLKPGINFVDDGVWDAVKNCEYVQRLKAEDKIDFGVATNKKVDEKDPSVKSQTKKVNTQAKAKAKPAD